MSCNERAPGRRAPQPCDGFGGQPPWRSPILAVAFATPGHGATASATYGYDQLGRIVTARYDNGVCVVYTYDPSGNRTSQTNSVSGNPESPVWGTGTWGCAQWTAAGMERAKPLRHRAREATGR